ncbi:uncharacterized protein LOC110028765 [Phalaenopsis equestris]|uniref:uncharacterized protein LOC110028765 n=1 Tax=Phalaenopsis equestris TaxID=78828 RepID=UPI0009E35E06|nr:uncharacterized protein LOC110028765 [Phalaenopsis equestris]
MWPNNENQRGNSPPTFQQLLIGNAGNANQQSTAGTQAANVVSGTGRWSSNVPLSSIATAAMVLHQQTGFPNLTPAFAPISSTVGLPMSIDQRNRAFEFCDASTSCRPKKASKQPGYSFSQQIPSLMGDFNVEVDALLNNFIKTINDRVQLSQMRYLKSMVAYIEQMASKRIQEKEAEVQNVNWKNSVLEERILKLCFDNNNLENRAIQNAILVSQLKATLKQAKAAPPLAGLLPAIEGMGDTDGKMKVKLIKGVNKNPNLMFK